MLSRVLHDYRRSLRLKIILPALAIMIVVVGALSAFAAILVQDSLRNAEYESASRHAVLMADDHALVLGILNQDANELERILKGALKSTISAAAIAVYRRPDDGPYTQLHRELKRADHASFFPAELGELEKHLPGRTGLDREGNEIFVVTAFVWMPPLPHTAVPLVSTTPVGLVQVAYTFEHAVQRGSHYLSVILLISLGITLFGTLATYRVTTNFLKPISALHAGLERISEGRLEHRIYTDRADEIGSMTGRFNEMAERLDSSQAQIQHHARVLEEKVIERTQELQSAYDELRTLDQAKDGFLSSISHEMRTPLTSILASVEILEEFADNDPGARREFLQIIQREANRMLSLVVDVLDLAKLEAQTIKLEIVSTDLVQLVAETVDSMRGMAADSSLKLTAQLPTQAIRYPCDVDRIRRVIRSLIHNAIKFSPTGASVEVELSLSARWASISVRDHGPGIPENEREEIFGLFSQPHSGRDRATSGVGLGLPISVKIVRMHGGDLRHEDPGDGGSRFVLALPLAVEEKAQQSAVPQTSAEAGG